MTNRWVRTLALDPPAEPPQLSRPEIARRAAAASAAARRLNKQHRWAAEMIQDGWRCVPPTPAGR